MKKHIKQLKLPEKLRSIDSLIKVAKVRITYCEGRILIEEARIQRKEGNHLRSSEEFEAASSKFNSLCLTFQNERKRKQLEAVYFLCKAWNSMELAEHYENPKRLIEASELFKKASELFSEKKMKNLALGNSIICLVREKGLNFDNEIDVEKKAQIYPQIKSLLRTAANFYNKGGLLKEAQWTLATSTYFDGAWQLIKADIELDMDARRILLHTGSEYLNTAAELYYNAGYKYKQEEILERLEMVHQEKKILISILSTIKESLISMSTSGIIAPPSTTVSWTVQQ